MKIEITKEEAFILLDGVQELKKLGQWPEEIELTINNLLLTLERINSGIEIEPSKEDKKEPQSYDDIKYKFIQNVALTGILTEIRTLVKEGWTPLGTPVQYSSWGNNSRPHTLFAQALIRD